MIDEILAAAARIGGHVLTTPLRHSPALSQASGANVFLKLETLQPTFSYKIRGATNAVLKLVEAGDGRPIVTASAGNHGRAMAHAAAAAGRRLTVYVSRKAPRFKVGAIQASGAVLVPCRDYDEAERRAKEHAADDKATYVSPYGHPDVIAGAGTIGLEILEEDPAIDAIVASVGGGGLISGLAIAAPSVEVCGAEVAASMPFTRSLEAGRIVKVEVADSIADGLVGNLDPGTPTFDIVRDRVKRIVVVQEDEVVAAVRRTFHEERLIVEGAAAAVLAAVHIRRLDLAGRRVVVVVSGANIDADKLKAII